jgi:bifunctional non-homologous end joining protein LigD
MTRRVKVKCLLRQEVVIGGWTNPGGGREALGALLVGYYRTPSDFVYCGRVGTGFTQQSLRDLYKLLEPLEQKTSPFSQPPAGVAARGVIHWVKPKVAAEVVLAEWTDDGLLSHPSFRGIREDKDPTEITREVPAEERVLEARPSANDDRSEGPTMPPASAATSKGKEHSVYIAVDDLAGLISLVQMGVLEIHPWGSRGDRIDRPDRLIFDIDPAVDLTWNDVVEAARDVRERLDDLGLVNFARTTWGKGLHVVVPLGRRSSWEELKTFAKSFASALVHEQPKRYIAQSSKAKRAGKLYLDYLRNERGATAIASYSTRARPGATVAAPLSWDELSASLRPAQFNVQTVPERLRTMKQDPWKGFFDIRQAITRAMHAQIERW